MTSFGRFFLPGPTEVRPEILAASARPVIGHRGRQMSDLLGSADAGLRALFGTSRPVYVSTSSATGLMEAGVRNGVRARALALVNGAFSERFAELVRDCGREVERYEVPWGAAHDPREVERRLSAGGFDALTLVHSETSTGVLNPVGEIAEAVRAAEGAADEEVLVLVDSVTGVGGASMAAEEWGLDWVLTGSHKALALPPGLAFGTASERLLRRAASLPGRGHYFDLLAFEREWQRWQTPQTPAVTLIFALVEQLQAIAHEGLEARLARHHAMAERCWQWAESAGATRGLRLLAPEGARSPTVTAITLPEGRNGPAISAAMRDRGFTIGSGYGKLRDGTIRIGHMGDHTVAELNEVLGALEQVLAS